MERRINMESKTKSKLTSVQISNMTKLAFGEDITPEVITELTDGYFNTAYMLTLSNEMKTVLKVSPPKNVLVMRYEKNLMEAEVEVLNKLKGTGEVKVPEVLFYDKSEKIIENEYFFMEFIEGEPLNKIRGELNKEQYKGISMELGSFVKEMHNIQGSYFGYISQVDKRFQGWDETFLYMISELLEDAKDAKVVLPYDYDKIYGIVHDKREVLGKVKAASLVHKDLWEGNIFVDKKSGEITGLVDCERALYGDTLLEPVCGFLLHNEDFMRSYLGRMDLDKDEAIRVQLYQLYLFLIMVIECSYRHYSDDNLFKWSSEQLSKVLTDLLK
jgi:aminoglycoside phosphotransferase (APT) family kinase protein